MRLTREGLPGTAGLTYGLGLTLIISKDRCRLIYKNMHSFGCSYFMIVIDLNLIKEAFKSF